MSNRLKYILDKNFEKEYVLQPNWFKHKVSCAFPSTKADVLYKLIDSQIPYEIDKIKYLDAKELYRITNFGLEEHQVDVYELMDMIVMWADAFGVPVLNEVKKEFVGHESSWTCTQLKPVKEVLCTCKICRTQFISYKKKRLYCYECEDAK